MNSCSRSMCVCINFLCSVLRNFFKAMNSLLTACLVMVSIR